MSRHGGWKAQRSSSGARATSLETAVAPIQHRRESACSPDVGFVPPALQRVTVHVLHLYCSSSLRPLLACALHTARVATRCEHWPPAAAVRHTRDIRYPQRMDGRAAIGTRTAELGRIDAFSQFTATYAWTPPCAYRRLMQTCICCADRTQLYRVPHSRG